MTAPRLHPISFDTLCGVRAKKKKQTGHLVYCGPKPFRASNAIIPRETVLLVRKLRDWSGWPYHRIALVTALSPSYINAICDWRVRVDIDPGPRPNPSSAAGVAWAASLLLLKPSEKTK